MPAVLFRVCALYAAALGSALWRWLSPHLLGVEQVPFCQHPIRCARSTTSVRDLTQGVPSPWLIAPLSLPPRKRRFLPRMHQRRHLTLQMPRMQAERQVQQPPETTNGATHGRRSTLSRESTVRYHHQALRYACMCVNTAYSHRVRGRGQCSVVGEGVKSSRHFAWHRCGGYHRDICAAVVAPLRRGFCCQCIRSDAARVFLLQGRAV